jgi:hypothetical protein
MNLDGVRSVADFEAIEIMDDSQPYPTRWELNGNFIIRISLI